MLNGAAGGVCGGAAAANENGTAGDAGAGGIPCTVGSAEGTACFAGGAVWFEFWLMAAGGAFGAVAFATKAAAPAPAKMGCAGQARDFVGCLSPL